MPATFSERAPRFKQVAESGFGVLGMSYRGYAGSGGSPSEAALFSDALEIFDWLAARSGDIVVHGESLGTASPPTLPPSAPAAALMLEAPFTAAVDIAAATYPWVPVSLLMRDPFLSRDHIRRVEEPVLILHGTADRVVPVDTGGGCSRRPASRSSSSSSRAPATPISGSGASGRPCWSS